MTASAPALHDTSRPRARLFAAAACLLLLFQSAILFQSRWVEDENWYANAGYTFVKEGRMRISCFPDTDYFARVDTRPPAMMLSQALSFRLFGLGVWQARLLSLLSAVAAVYLVFLLGAELVNPWVGVFAAFLLAVDNFVFSAARIARPEAFLTLLFTAALYSYVHSRRRNSIALAVVSGLCIGLALNFHVNGIGLAAALGLIMLLDFRTAIWRQPRAWAVVAAAALTLVPFVLWIAASPLRTAAFKDLYIGRAALPYAAKLAGEKLRFADFIGLGSQRVSLPFHVPFPTPYRIHIALAILVAAAMLLAWRRSRPAALALVATIGVNLFWWSTLFNKSSRYFAVLAPLFAILLAWAAYEWIGRPRWRRAALAVIAILIATQLAGNLLLLTRYRNSGYPALGRELRRAVPQNVSVYGAITFWMALHDRNYISWDRAPFDYTVANLRPEYVILNDRVMVHGSGYGGNEFEPLRRDWNAFAHSHGVLVSTIDHPFYGGLEIYRIPEFAPRPPP